jgi:hypothetical protein
MSDPIAEYFAQYPDFNYCPSKDGWRQFGAFNALCTHRGLTQEERSNELEEFKKTWYDVVNTEFDGSTLDHYQELCLHLGIWPAPDSVKECKDRVSTVFVNIVDLVQYRKERRAGKYPDRVEKFSTLKELKQYSTREKKWYPPEAAEAEMLKELLKVFY